MLPPSKDTTRRRALSAPVSLLYHGIAHPSSKKLKEAATSTVDWRMKFPFEPREVLLMMLSEPKSSGDSGCRLGLGSRRLRFRRCGSAGNRHDSEDRIRSSWLRLRQSKLPVRAGWMMHVAYLKVPRRQSPLLANMRLRRRPSSYQNFRQDLARWRMPAAMPFEALLGSSNRSKVCVRPSHLESLAWTRKDRVHAGIGGHDDKREREDAPAVSNAGTARVRFSAPVVHVGDAGVAVDDECHATAAPRLEPAQPSFVPRPRDFIAFEWTRPSKSPNFGDEIKISPISRCCIDPLVRGHCTSSSARSRRKRREYHGRARLDIEFDERWDVDSADSHLRNCLRVDLRSSLRLID